jgi:hypothetical protein
VTTTVLVKMSETGAALASSTWAVVGNLFMREEFATATVISKMPVTWAVATLATWAE